MGILRRGGDSTVCRLSNYHGRFECVRVPRNKTMENTTFDFSLYVGKIGIDNVLLMTVGVLFFILYTLKRQEAKYDRLLIYLYSSFFFLGYGFMFDAYRLKVLRKYLLWNLSFSPYKTVVLLVTLLPLYSCLIESILRILSERYRKKTP